ncbi:hypothetical protein ACWKSP_39650 [Micromonosporaceae bacterium Da 78-11]
MVQRTRVPENGHPTLERLLERAESQDRIEDAGDRSVFDRAPAADRPAFNRSPAADRAAFDRSAADRAPAAEPGFGSAESRHAAIGDTGAAFAELMAGLDVNGHNAMPPAARPSPRPKSAAPAREDTPTVRPFRPATATGAPVNSPGSKPMPPMPSLAERIGGLAGSTIEDHTPPPLPVADPAPMQSAATVFGLNAATVVEPIAPISAPPVAAAPVAAAPIAAIPELATPIPAVPVAAPVEVAPIAAPVVAAAPAPAPARVLVADPDPVVRNLVSVGMPESMANKITGGDTYAGVLSVLASRPAAPAVPDGPGEILVLAGDVNLGVPIAKALLEQIGVGENHLLLAAPSTAGTGLHSSKLISTREVAESRVEKLHSADAPWVVVMDAPVGGTDPLWVNEMCDAIGATAVWAIVDATRKTPDTARHLRTLGEVESLVVHGVELTGDPASVLGLDLPIFSLDGKPATPHAWAAMLCARIAADVLPMAAVPRRVARTVRP